MCAHLLPFSAFQHQLVGGGTSLAAFNWITQNICNDGHDCPAQNAGQWLSGLVSQITSTTAWRSNGIITVTWDEGGFPMTARSPPPELCCQAGAEETL